MEPLTIFAFFMSLAALCGLAYRELSIETALPAEMVIYKNFYV